MLLLGSGLAAPAHATSATSDSRLDVALLQRVDSLNPFVGISASAQQIFGLAYDRLTDYRNTDNRPTPGLAESWRTSADGRTWTFTIRGGVRWSDGTPLTAADLAFTYTTIMREPTSVNASMVAAFTSVTAPDATTLVIETSAYTPTMLNLDIPIVPAHIWRTRDPMAEPPTADAMVGSGPFRLVEARPGEQYRLERRPDHWRGTPGPATVVLRQFTNSDAAAQALRTGEIDVVGNLTPAQFDALTDDPAIATNEARGTRFTHLGFNPGAARADGTAIGDGHPALHDPRVRTAVEQAIDRRTLVDRVLLGHGDPGLAYFPPTYQPWAWTPARPPRAFDPAAAERLLDAAGYPRGPNGRRQLEFRLFAPVERAHYQQSAAFITEWLAAVGITVKVTTMADTQLGQRVRAGRYDLFLSGWILDPDPAFLLSVHTCAARPDAAGNGTTDSFTCDPQWDELYRRQSHELDPTRRVALVQQMQQRLYEAATLVPLYYPSVLEAYRSDHFRGLTRRPTASGSLVGAWSYVTATPVITAAAPAHDRTGVVVGVLLAVLLAGAAGLAVHRRRSGRHLRE
ncbi:ABC transporter substrate-binding protein [Amorphoplanes digitatis]|uniref:Peptide/nickel transport system substrate-binding protein n=1 Tax=Actinoplanes digitatis TaxID=1868 RepID=A0A7W7I233_9ACTN|nr:ABC transporter substrate-binding protein [Actinoplanes digitatis]MBB4764970.1 peptide/nickel transport system substrate-binding protein [Actinoplanes digitatis]GID93936.1 peptide ABC transporter substrate-binding protein [Actinoplanes digitatis]